MSAVQSGSLFKNSRLYVFLALVAVVCLVPTRSALPQDGPTFQEPTEKTHVIPSIGYEMAYIPPGTFMMGSPPDEPGRQEEEKQHKVTLSRGYYIGVYEVTQKQWVSIMGHNPSNPKNRGDDYPIQYISWRDALRFIGKLNEEEGTESYALPTEAQWEYACRAISDYGQYERGGQYRGDVGVRVEDLGPRDPEYTGPDIKGVEVVHVSPEGPGGRADIREKDIIMRVNGKRTSFTSTFTRIVENSPEGQILRVDVARHLGRDPQNPEFPVYQAAAVFVRVGRSLYPNYDTPAFFFGDDPEKLGDYAWYKENSDNLLHPVGEKLPNPWGLYDIYGNIPEWCRDRFGTYPSGHVVDPTGPGKGITYRVHRGGGYYYTAQRCRSAYRGGFEGRLKGANMGIRLVKNF
ncbi:MAG: SUMF1/EgtB/PvdO family nonheme iron enzyme [Desulfatibacillaceae bacterium]